MSSDSAVNDGYADAGAIEPKLRFRDIRLDCGGKLFGRRIRSRAYLTVGRDVNDVGIVRQLREHAGGHSHRHRSDHRQLRLDGCATGLRSLQVLAGRHLVELNNDRHRAVLAYRRLQIAGAFTRRRLDTSVGRNCRKQQKHYPKNSAPGSTELRGIEWTVYASVCDLRFIGAVHKFFPIAFSKAWHIAPSWLAFSGQLRGQSHHG